MSEVILHGAAVFVAAIFLDVVWTRWTLSMTAHRAERAAGWAALIVLIGVFNVGTAYPQLAVRQSVLMLRSDEQDQGLPYPQIVGEPSRNKKVKLVAHG